MKKLLIIAAILILNGCEKANILGENEEPSLVVYSTNSLNCTAQAEELDYNIYPMTSDRYRVGDMANTNLEIFVDNSDVNFENVKVTIPLTT